MVMLQSRIIGSFLQWGIVLLLILLFNQLLHKSNGVARYDLTEDQRYSIDESSKKLLKELDDVVYVEVFLEGSLPAGFQRLKNSIREKLTEFKIYAGSNLRFRFIDPETAQSENAKNEFFRSLGLKGIQPTNVFATEEGKRTQKLIFPGALISFGGREQGVMLLKGNRSSDAQERLNQSIENVEYELIRAIKQLTSQTTKRVAFTQGHGELEGAEIASITNSLLEEYQVVSVDLSRKASLAAYDAVIIAKPTQPFNSADQYKIDQYVMNGGKLLLFLDALDVKMDSAGGEGTVAFPYESNLEKLLFKYGIRVNYDLVQDLNSGTYPVVTGNFGDQPQISLLPWPFHPVVVDFPDFTPVRNMDAVTIRFASTIDSVKATGIKKRPMMYTSPYSRVYNSPVSIAFNDFSSPPQPETYNQGKQVLAYMLEGSFTSLFKNRPLPRSAQPDQFKPEGVSTQIFVCSDGDFIRNELNVEDNRPLDLGYEQFTKTQFANQDLVLNVLTYMLDDYGITQARNKEIKLRQLDKIKVEQERLFWQFFNIAIPVLLVILLAGVKYILRTKKYARN
jgi:gliding-associated putative ABC transporter substrate-binding component GldG